MKLSIVICTFNRSQELESLLDELTLQHKRLRSSEASEVEVILVDSNSFDETKEVAYRYMENTGLSIKYFCENQLGLSAARNLAVIKASGDLLAFLHDDISLDDDWLKESYRLACKCIDEEIGVYGGRVIPIWKESLPEWLNIEAPHNVKQEVFKSHSFDDEIKYYPFNTDLGLAEFPSGVNVYIRKEIFENCGNFRADLGPSASANIGLHEDYEFFEYLSKLKIPMQYLPQCIVFNAINKQQMTIQYLRRWHFKSAKALYWIAHTDRMKRIAQPLLGIAPRYRHMIPSFMKSKIDGVPIFLYAKLAAQVLYWLFMHLTLNNKKRYWLSYKISETFGEIEAAKLVSNTVFTKKFSFKERLSKKGLVKIS